MQLVFRMADGVLRVGCDAAFQVGCNVRNWLATKRPPQVKANDGNGDRAVPHIPGPRRVKEVRVL